MESTFIEDHEQTWMHNAKFIFKAHLNDYYLKSTKSKVSRDMSETLLIRAKNNLWDKSCWGISPQRWSISFFLAGTNQNRLHKNRRQRIWQWVAKLSRLLDGIRTRSMCAWESIVKALSFVRRLPKPIKSIDRSIHRSFDRCMRVNRSRSIGSFHWCMHANRSWSIGSFHWCMHANWSQKLSHFVRWRA